MTWIVRVALDRPYTFIVLALVILIFGPLAALRTPTDIFPDIGIPGDRRRLQYSGLSPDEMARPDDDASSSASCPPPSTISSISKASPSPASASSRSSSSPMSISAWPRRR